MTVTPYQAEMIILSSKTPCALEISLGEELSYRVGKRGSFIYCAEKGVDVLLIHSVEKVEFRDALTFSGSSGISLEVQIKDKPAIDDSKVQLKRA